MTLVEPLTSAVKMNSTEVNVSSGSLEVLFPPLTVAQRWHVLATVAFFSANFIGNSALAVAAWMGLRRSRRATRRLSLVTDFPQATRRPKEPKATACDHILIAVFIVALCRSCTRAPVQIVQMLSGKTGRRNAH